ncbi:MAG: hypothetical protein JOZ19_04835 [Rubrobacter sp.]|nr:hypothetical protein [Rubrobacter sp.]
MKEACFEWVEVSYSVMPCYCLVTRYSGFHRVREILNREIDDRLPKNRGVAQILYKHPYYGYLRALMFSEAKMYQRAGPTDTCREDGIKGKTVAMFSRPVESLIRLIHRRMLIPYYGDIEAGIEEVVLLNAPKVRLPRNGVSASTVLIVATRCCCSNI